MEFQFDFRRETYGSCAVSSNLSSLPDWAQKEMSNWKSGDTFRVVTKKLVDGVSVYEEKLFKLEVIEERKGNY
jgi:fibrillarin-like rRNA methylase